MKPKVVIAGFGDTGLLVAINLSSRFDVVGISAKPCLVSGQELGLRLTQPQQWKRDYLVGFERYKKLKDVRTIHGLITKIDDKESTVTVELASGELHQEAYDVLVIAAGVSNGFWRTNSLQSMVEVEQAIASTAQQLEQTRSLAVIGGGATGVSAAVNFARQYPEKKVDLFYSQQQPLPGYHPKVRQQVLDKLQALQVSLHPAHRAVMPEGFYGEHLTSMPIHWTTGQPAFSAELTLWAIGAVKPNNHFIPKAMLNAAGFVNTDSYLRVQGFNNVFAVGDIAASDVNRSSARNGGFKLVADNIKAHCFGRDEDMKVFQPAAYRWGSIFGNQPEGLTVFSPQGKGFRIPRYWVDKVLFPWVVQKQIYKGLYPLLVNN
ncbi:FAD-dependent oxidoreductase [Oceanicoccus sp. KOV_DT_Chl]|uniref:FAD-dependent oxidoreductase n=1 Tax=Oceanicoccus sp. KOV_DT_Chl TaxID=1904639 RepID=UPI000C7CAC53|nr:FAD-dependent oxidoreductase [Oceanicoccus sp. KOV_DT_Chl]